MQRYNVDPGGQGASDQVMSDQLGPKIINLCVAKFSNSGAITCIPRLDIDHFESQFDSLRLNQRLLNA
jgi:hypothetical protein